MGFALGLQTNFAAPEWAIVVIYPTATVAIGIYANRHVGNMADSVVAGRSLEPTLDIATIISIELGLATVMYMAWKGVMNGFAALHLAKMAVGIGMLIVAMTGFIVVPQRRMDVHDRSGCLAPAYRAASRLVCG